MSQRRFSSLVFCLLLIFSMTAAQSASAFTVEPCATKVTPTLTFSGTTANCKATITAAGTITATLQLWKGNTLVDSWPGTGTNYLAIHGSCEVISGQTYTLKVVGTAGGSPISVAPVTGTCP